MKHTNLGLLWMCTCIFSLLYYAPTFAQCTLACNSLVQVSIPEEGFAIIDSDMIMEGDSTSCPGPKTVVVELPSGEAIGDTVTCGHIGMTLDVMVIDDATGTFCWGSILVEDKLKPIITCQDTTVSCTADLSPSAIGLVTVTDNCDDDPDLSSVSTFSPQACSTSLSQILTRTWYATDSSGNMAVPCVQTISMVRPTLLEVEFPPNFDNTDTLALDCENPDTSVLSTGAPMVDSLPIGAFCKINTTYEDLVVNGCENEFSVFRKWTVLDCCTGEILTHTQHIKVDDADGPTLTCPDTIAVNANGPDCDAFFLLPPIGAEDNCSSNLNFRTVVPGHFDQEGNGGIVHALPLGTYLLMYEVTDNCLNQSTCEVTLEVMDGTPPAAICDEITAVSLSSLGQANISATVFDDGSHDNCCGVGFLAKRMDEPTAPFEPNVLFDCEDIGDTVMVIVQVSDCHGNANTCMVEVHPDDNSPPQLTCPPDVTIECTVWVNGAPPAVLGEPILVENCFLDTFFYEDTENLDLCNLGTVTRTFTAVDGGGLMDQCSHTITTFDTTEVHYFFPADTVVDCSVPLDSISAGEVFATDDCELVGLNVSDQIFPINCGLKIFRTYTFLDWCSGFDTSYTQFITVIDTNPPVWDDPPGSFDTMFVCPGDLVKPPPPTASDFCSPVTVTLDADSTLFMGCDNRFVRTLVYGATDTCGNVAEPFIITLMVDDTLGPVPFLDDEFYECLDDIPDFNPDDVPAVDNCFGDVTVELVEEVFDTIGCVGSIMRTYLLTDVCGLDTLATQAFFYGDTIPPELLDDMIGPFPTFGDIPAPTTVAGADNCNGMVTSQFMFDDIVDDDPCSGLVERHWMLFDECGNSAEVTQLITVSDETGPSVSCPPDFFMTIGDPETCSFELQIIVTGDDVNGPVTMSNNITGVADTLTADFPVGSTQVVFSAEDQCGNIGTCQMNIHINEVGAPSSFCEDFDVYMEPDGTTIVNVDSLVTVGVLGGEDICSGVVFDFFPDTLTCDSFDTNPTPIPYIFTVTDASNNSSTCMDTLYLFDTLNVCDTGLLVAMVAGRVDMHTGDPMPYLDLHLSDPTGTLMTQTNENGLYFFEDIPPGENCFLAPQKNDDLLNGVTTFDLLLITQHILNEQLLASPYDLIAADVNASGAISTFDVLELRKAVLHISDEFANNTSWRFLRADYEFPNPNDPFEEPLPESIWLPNVEGEMVGKDFTAIKIGDVNGSALPSFWGGDIEDRSKKSYPLSTFERDLEKGTTARIPIFASGENTLLSALQATIDFDYRKMNFSSIEGAQLPIGTRDYAEAGPGLLTLAWFDAHPISVNPAEPLFYLYYEVLENTPLTPAFLMNSAKTPAMAYGTNGSPMHISWHIRSARLLAADAASAFELSPNRPNPFHDETTFSIWVDEAMPVRLELVDFSGRTRTVLEKEVAKGWHEVKLTREHFQNSGLYICRLVTPFGADQRHLVFQE